MYIKNMVIWEDVYKTGIEVIDNQHKKFVEILNQLYDAVDNHKDKKAIDQVFEGLVNYGKYHFATEEKYFDEFNFEEALEHKEKHKEFKQKIADYQAKINNGQIEITNDLINFLEEWLVTHLVEVDKKYVKCFKEHGLR